MQPSDGLHSLAIVPISNETALDNTCYAQVCVDDIVCLTNQPFKDKLEQLEAVFQQVRLNAQALRSAKAAWTQAGDWITHGCSPLAPRNAQGTRRISERELFRFGKMSNYLRAIGMWCMPILSPMAMVPSNQDPQEDKTNALTISHDAIEPRSMPKSGTYPALTLHEESFGG